MCTACEEDGKLTVTVSFGQTLTHNAFSTDDSSTTRRKSAEDSRSLQSSRWLKAHKNATSFRSKLRIFRRQETHESSGDESKTRSGSRFRRRNTTAEKSERTSGAKETARMITASSYSDDTEFEVSKGRHRARRKRDMTVGRKETTSIT
ncbi:hypothetical protein BDZ89DRAFT_1252754 [Hymenopellis radicata]|nr:hypothetical protein BDZ89DRAFT_1252754 [Hymenopellis radicata]